jgi:hypothetical protein
MEKIDIPDRSKKAKKGLEEHLSAEEDGNESDQMDPPKKKRMKVEEGLLEVIPKDPKGVSTIKQSANEEADKENIERGLAPLSSKSQEIVKVYEAIIENLKTNNTPDKVQFRSVERLKVTNFLRR